MATRWDERERNKEWNFFQTYKGYFTDQARSDLLRKTASPGDCICYDAKSGLSCTPREEHEVGVAYGTYLLRTRTTVRDQVAASRALEDKRVAPKWGIGIQNGKCEHGVAYIEVSKKGYMKVDDAQMVELVRDTAARLLAEILR